MKPHHPSKINDCFREPEDPFDEFVQDFECTPFTTLKILRKRLEDRRIALEDNKTNDQFIALSNVLNKSNDSRRFTRFFDNTVTLILVVKVMLEPEHDIASIEFEHCIYD